MTLCIELDELPEAVQESLARGETVEVARGGEVVATVAARERRRRISWEEFVAARLESPPLDDEFERASAQARELLNQPQRDPPSWEL
ncbi:MAG: hypothetical protein ACR2HN_13740 [Tepidiformaceae bacterium]